MYRITRLQMFNICQHESLDLTFDSGLWAICGRNGQGKSNLLRGLVYGLTGMVDGMWGNQQRLQKDGTAEPGWVKLTICGMDHTYLLRRFSTSNIKFPDELSEVTPDGESKVATRRRDVDAAVEGLLGISCALMFQICWGRQGEMDMLLTAPAAFINTFLGSVFDTKVFDKLREKLKTQLDTIANMPPSCIEALRCAKAELAGLDPLEGLQARVSALYAREQAAANSFAELDSGNGLTAEAAASKIQGLRDIISGINIPDLGACPEDIGQTSEALKSQIYGNQDLLQKLYKKMESAQTRRASIEQNLDVYKQCAEDVREGDLSLEARLHSEGDVCEYCAGHIVDREAYMNAKCLSLSGYATVDAWRASGILMAKGRAANILKCETDMLECDALIQKYEPVAVKLQGQTDALQKLLESAVAYESWVAANASCTAAEAYKAHLEAQIAEIEAAPKVPNDIIQAKAQLRRDLDVLKKMLREAEKIEADNEARRKYLARTIAETEAQVEQYEINVQARDMLVQLRDVFSQSRAQARYLRTRISELNVSIAAYMRYTDMPFSVYLNEDTHLFECTTSDGYVHPACHLSGAQRNISAVILQMAILSAVRPNMNLFLVDEPSEALDIENKRKMADLLQRMNNMLGTIDGLMLIVTRDDELIEYCTNRVDLGTTQGAV